MKKLIVVLAVVVSGFVNAQTVEEIEQFKKDCDCDVTLSSDTYNSISELDNWFNNTHTFKTGDNDKAATAGILKDIFTDPAAKFKYEKINPRIGQLQVNGFSFDTISYSNWIASIPVYDTSKYEFIYSFSNNGVEYKHDPSISLNESIDVFDKSTGSNIRTIFIVYTSGNFRSIFDSSISK
jgi:hypothetical protein